MNVSKQYRLYFDIKWIYCLLRDMQITCMLLFFLVVGQNLGPNREMQIFIGFTRGEKKTFYAKWSIILIKNSKSKYEQITKHCISCCWNMTHDICCIQKLQSKKFPCQQSSFCHKCTHSGEFVTFLKHQTGLQLYSILF